MLNYIRNREENTIYEYFPNQRIPSSLRYNEISVNQESFKTIDEYCKFIWWWEAKYWNYPRFIFTHGYTEQ